MSFIQALIIGLLQGLTEFIPVSSSAHLKLAKILMGWENTENFILFDLACHFGTLIAVLIFLRKEIRQLIAVDKKSLGLIFLATLPLVPAYFLLKPLREFASQSHFLGFCLMITACILFVGEKIRIKRLENASLKREIHDVLWIGVWQSAALIPGISRSASTISCAHVLGWNGARAVRFSFLLSIPTILGGNCLELLKLSLSHEYLPSHSFLCLFLGFLSALGMGLLVIPYALKWLEKGSLRPFAWYCLILGITVSAFFYCLR